MGCQSEVTIGDNLTFSITTHDPDTGVLTDADSTPSYRVYEDETGTAILSGSMAKLDDGNTTGFYSEQLACTSANGFEDGKSYNIYITATVDSDQGGTCYGFRALSKDAGSLNDLAQSDILSDATPFAGGNIDAAISSRSSHGDPDPSGYIDAAISSRSTFDASTDTVTLADGAHGGASASLTLSDYTDFQATGFSTHSAADVWTVGTRELTGAANVTSTGGTLYVDASGHVKVEGATNTLDALSTHGDSNWATATGFSTHAAADIWSVGTRTLTGPANLTSTGGTIYLDANGYVQIEGTANQLDDLNDVSQADVNSACDTALTDYDAVVPGDLPTNFADLSITATDGRVDVATIEGSDATDQINAACDTALTDYDAVVPADLPINFSNLSITAGGLVDVDDSTPIDANVTEAGGDAIQATSGEFHVLDGSGNAVATASSISALNDLSQSDVQTAISGWTGWTAGGSTEFGTAMKDIYAYCTGDISKSTNAYTYADVDDGTNLYTLTLDDTAGTRTRS